MKPFNIFVTISLVLILGGFVFFKNNFTSVGSGAPSEPATNFDMANYLSYSPAAQATAQKRGKTVLFFAATAWCQTCSALEKEIISRLNDIPVESTILKVDYDNDTAMNQQYAVTSQHTLIILDRDGKEIKRWVGGDLDTILQELDNN